MKKTIFVFLVIVIITSVLAVTSNATKFNDVSSDSWMENPIYYCYNNGIIDKKTNATFAPNVNMTRGECLHGILKALNINTSNYTITNAFFTDVPMNHHYAKDIYWAYDHNITSGMSPTFFGVDNTVLRQDFCVFINKACLAISFTLPKYVSDDVVFNPPDLNNISSYALQSVEKAFRAELISGSTGGYLYPKSNITRAESAVMLMKLSGLKNNPAEGYVNVYVWNEDTGNSLGGAYVYAYFLNPNPGVYNHYYPRFAGTTNNYGKLSYFIPNDPDDVVNYVAIPDTVALNVFKAEYMQGVSKSGSNQTKRFYIAVKLKGHLDTNYISPFKTASPHEYSTTQNYLISCRNYGYRYSDNSQREFHQGLDYLYGADYTEKDVYSVSSGEVNYIGIDNDYYGNYVQIYDTIKQVYITYQHLKNNSINVVLHQTVSPSTIIGVVGNTGHVTGPHLHISFSKSESLQLSSRKYLDPVGMLGYMFNGSYLQTMTYSGN